MTIQMCLKIDVDLKSQKAVGFPEGWKFAFDKCTKKSYEEYKGLLIIPPPSGRNIRYSAGKSCRPDLRQNQSRDKILIHPRVPFCLFCGLSVENAINHNKIALADVNVAFFYDYVGLAVTPVPLAEGALKRRSSNSSGESRAVRQKISEDEDGNDQQMKVRLSALHERRCKRCKQCTKQACGKCSPCRAKGLHGPHELNGRQVCLHKVSQLVLLFVTYYCCDLFCC